VHEDNLTCGFGAEIAATIAQEAFMDLEAPVIRLAASDQPVPYNQNLMAALSPSTESVKREIENLLDY
jgi:2-oxoisovalerate dehydrogenase E1 component